MNRNQLIELFENKIRDCDDINNAPFGFDHKQSRAYLQGKAATLTWVLEMLPSKDEY